MTEAKSGAPCKQTTKMDFFFPASTSLGTTPVQMVRKKCRMNLSRDTFSSIGRKSYERKFPVS